MFKELSDEEFREKCHKWHIKMWEWISHEATTTGDVIWEFKKRFVYRHATNIMEDFGFCDVDTVREELANSAFCFACYYARYMQHESFKPPRSFMCSWCPIQWISEEEMTQYNGFFCEEGSSPYRTLYRTFYIGEAESDAEPLADLIAHLPWDRY